LEATVELAHEFGINEVTMVGICRLTRIARGSFYELFSGISGCLEYAFGEAYNSLIEPVEQAQEESTSWLEGLAGAVGAFYLAVANNPLLAELCLVHSAGAAAEAHGRDAEAVVNVIAGVIEGGRKAGDDSSPEAEHRTPRQIDTEQILARGIVSMAALRTRQGNAELLPEHRDEMVMLVVSTLFGADAMAQARRQLDSGRFTTLA
jgi:AcrR family transcriptional regulator